MMKTTPSQPERRRIKLKALLPHSLQPLYYTATTQDEDDRLLDDLRQHGQRDAIVVVPKKRNGRWIHIILDGHRRVRAAEVLGWASLNAIIRWDLAEADDSVIESEFLQYNLNRRHLHQIDRARIALRQFQIERKRPRGEVRPWDEHEARERVGKAIGMCGRNLSRYFRLLLAPLEIQNAVRDGRLALVLGEKVSWLTKPQQAEIAKRIRADENAKSVVGEYIAPANGRHRKAEDAFVGFAKDLERALADLEDRPDEIYRVTLKEHRPLLDRARKLLTKLIAEGRKKPGDIAELFRGPNAHGAQEYFGDMV
jgi:ParB/RepB/Spo0J family partition protein